jgi:hypothetical protein
MPDLIEFSRREFQAGGDGEGHLAARNLDGVAVMT